MSPHEGTSAIDTEITFPSREGFRSWLTANALFDEAVWLASGWPDGPITLRPSEALGEALCFGWIDGRMQKVDDASYRKHFCKRHPDSNWSEKNKNLAAALEARKLMTDHGRAKIEEAKAIGQRDAPKAPRVTEEDIDSVASLLIPYELSHTSFLKMPPSARKTSARAYLNAKTDADRERHLAWTVERLDKNLKPMETSA